MKGLSWNFPLCLLQGVGNPIGKGQGDAMRIIHLGIQYLLSFMTHAVMQLATLPHRISTWHINNKAPVKRDWIGSFPPYYFHTTHKIREPIQPIKLFNWCQLKWKHGFQTFSSAQNSGCCCNNPGGMAHWLPPFFFLDLWYPNNRPRFSLLSNYLLKHLDKQNIDWHTAESLKHVKSSGSLCENIHQSCHVQIAQKKHGLPLTRTKWLPNSRPEFESGVHPHGVDTLYLPNPYESWFNGMKQRRYIGALFGVI